MADIVTIIVVSIVVIPALCPTTLLLLVVDAKVVATQLSQRVVTTRYGQLRGILVTLPVAAGISSLPPVEAYLGIEYGSLLGGELRFMPPTSPVSRWEGVRSALKFRPVCPQHIPTSLLAAPPSGGSGSSSATSMNGASGSAAALPQRRIEILKRLRPFLERQNEECLSLNIYVPVTGKFIKRILFIVEFHSFRPPISVDLRLTH
jgi:hypothetical protein